MKPDSLSVEKHLTLIWNERPGERLDERGLACTVVADDAEDLAALKFEVSTIESGDMTVALDETASLHHQGRRRSGHALTSRDVTTGRLRQRGSPESR